MGDPVRRRATYEDVLAAPEHLTAELIDGELYLSPRPASPHAVAAGALHGDLREAFGRRRGGRGPGGWWLLIEPELHLGGPDPKSLVLVPDLAGCRRERMPTIPDVPAFTLAPDWVCEVVSPGSTAIRRDRVLKPDLYARAGVGHLWLVDPLAQTLEVWRLQDGIYARVQAFVQDAVVRAEPFEAVELDLGGWWLSSAEGSTGEGRST